MFKCLQCGGSFKQPYRAPSGTDEPECTLCGSANVFDNGNVKLHNAIRNVVLGIIGIIMLLGWLIGYDFPSHSW